MKGPVIVTSDVKILGFKKSEKKEYQWQSTLMFLTGRTVYHGPVDEMNKSMKRQISAGLKININLIDHVLKSLNKADFVLMYKN